MLLKTLFFLFFNVQLVVMLKFAKPVAEKVWSERCERHTIALNDCNYCHCNAKSAYTCNARSCDEVDMFGHFNDAIREMDVGMEGHGVWRSEETACEPGVHYKKNELLCVCTEDSKWPNPVCRDIFRVLHAVETTSHDEPLANDTCAATKLYLYGCNVCFCPASGTIDPKLCTKKICPSEPLESSHDVGLETVEEVYASCIATKRYKLGCQTCVCLRNNRLLCDNCSSQNNADAAMKNSACYGKTPGEAFKKDCNYCHCDENGTIYCSAKKCLSTHTSISLPNIEYEVVEYKQDYYNCAPGSKYEKDCNTCHCFELEGVKYVGCTTNLCTEEDKAANKSCIESTSYQANCFICHCVVKNDTKMEFCTIDKTCSVRERDSKPLSSMHGYCEPMHYYQHDCNKCRCLPDGKTLACTSRNCTKKDRKEKFRGKDKPEVLLENEYSVTKEDSNETSKDDKIITMEFIPFIQQDQSCARGRTYTVDCNICYCMKNGNAICTTKQC